MPRRRRTGSTGRVRKKARKVDVHAVESLVNSKDSSDIGTVASSGSRRVTRSSGTLHQSFPREIAAHVKEATLHLSHEDPLQLETSSLRKDSSDRDRADVDHNVANCSLVKLEVGDEISTVVPEDVSNTTGLDVTAIKLEEVDCGIQSLDEELEQNENLVSIFRALKTIPLLPNSLKSSFIAEVEKCFNASLPQDWFCKSTEEGFNVMLLSRCKEKAIQRRIFISFQSDVEVSVHRRPLLSLDVEQLLSGLLPVVSLTPGSCQVFVEQVMKIVHQLCFFEICCGVDQHLKHLWSKENTTGVFDDNPYGEMRYINTVRSSQCKFLVESTRWRCKKCVKLTEMLGKKDKLMNKGKLLHNGEKTPESCVQLVPNQPNSSKPLTKHVDAPKFSVFEEENTVVSCVSTVTKELKVAQAILELKQSPHKTSVPNNQNILKVESEGDESVNMTMPKEELNREPKIQLTGVDTKKWEPLSITKKIRDQIEKDGILVDDVLCKDLSDITKDLKLSDVQQRFILEQTELATAQKSFGMRWHPTLVRFALFKKLTSSEKYTATGMITLPSGRTLFNFSQILFKIKEFQKANIDDIVKVVKSASSLLHHAYHVLIMDEIDVSNNLVFQRSNGELIGFVKLSDAKTEMEQLEDFINTSKLITLRPVACKMLMYMVKGVSNGVREAVALLASENMPKQMVYHMTWDVIDTLEQAGIKVLALVSNGSPTTKDFIRLHTPVTRLQSGLVYDTINIRAQGRLLYFFMDASYLLKAIRNSFEESGAPGTNRLLTKNKQPLVWKTIVKLYLAQKWLCPKLNAKNVFLNDHSRKRPAHAVDIFSPAVAKDLTSRYWPNTSETVDFIYKINGLYERLHGTEKDEASPDVSPSAPYTSEKDKRYSEMLEFVDYLKKWKKEVYDIPNLSAEDRSKLLLGDELCREIELSVRAFIDASKFLLKEGADKIYAHTFSVDSIGGYLQEGWFGFRFSCNSVLPQSK